ncbi:hypothetical protein Gogos_020982 [Gossypium gossypioides]|uniref:Uncharacterized protein n=1 Tax=Gossypium gossypioides TaxID=34282 RepID=A0A7J9D2A4_GOSGO|nr:hypothetical protein [Gossypium gossypioides]
MEKETSKSIPNFTQEDR